MSSSNKNPAEPRSDQDSDPSSEPPLLTDWIIGDVLGVGTVGTIYFATNRNTGQQAALKKLHPRVSNDPLIRARFKREMTVLQRLRHPNIVAYLGGQTGGETLWYLMEFVDGGTVKELLKAGPLPWLAVVDVARQLCSALQCAHNNGIVHRDLKPGNLFVTREGEVKLGDFGIARDLTREDLTAKGFTVGTHAYMAPEQITGDLSVSGKADLYALGCCLFEMLTNRKPFLGENYTQLFDQHLKSIPPHANAFVSSVPPELDAIIFELMAKDPEERPFNARQVQATMLRICESIDTASEDGQPAALQGRDQLVKRIHARYQPNPQATVGLTKLLLIFAIIVIVVVIAAVASQ